MVDDRSGRRGMPVPDETQASEHLHRRGGFQPNP
jgi:hypothetical protein